MLIRTLFSLVTLVFCFSSSLLYGDIVAYYDFESPDPFADRTGNGHDASATETTTIELVEGAVGQAAQFLGAGPGTFDITEDDFLTVPMAQAPSFGTSDISVSLWFRRNSPQDDIGDAGGDGGADGIYDSLSGTDSGIQLFLLSPGTVNGRFDTTDAGFVVVNSEPFALEDNYDEPDTFQWHHIAYTLDRTNNDARLYVDGLETDSFSPAGDIADIDGGNVVASQDFWIGRANEHSADGLIDDFALFDHVLSADDVTALFEQTLSPADFLNNVGLSGDYDLDGLLTAADIDRLSEAVRDGLTDAIYDLDENGQVDMFDRFFWVESLKNTWVGDSNLDGEFNSSDLVAIFTAAKYETGEDASWSEGDWNGDGLCDTSDFVSAFGLRGYEQGPRGVAAVPEPHAFGLLALGCLGLLRTRRSNK
ncbi:MAG: hypothetical protein KDA87_24745 [Planctomycetales bacterium]|nr:hypothetical protein [Planctomycetales bacterium]